MDTTTSTLADDEVLLTPVEAATRLGISRRQLDRMRLRGEGPAYLLLSPRVRKYRASAIDAFLRSSQRLPSAS